MGKMGLVQRAEPMKNPNSVPTMKSFRKKIRNSADPIPWPPPQSNRLEKKTIGHAPFFNSPTFHPPILPILPIHPATVEADVTLIRRTGDDGVSCHDPDAWVAIFKPRNPSPRDGAEIFAPVVVTGKSQKTYGENIHGNVTTFLALKRRNSVFGQLVFS